MSLEILQPQKHIFSAMELISIKVRVELRSDSF